MLKERLAALTCVCDEDELDLVEKMVLAAADYVQAVVRMETTAMNVAGRREAELRTAVEQTDRTRRSSHNALISLVDIVDRICQAHELPKLYGGDSLRRHYGDFAMALMQEFFTARR